MSKNKKPGSYEVGYGKPPREHQFQKGKSGNPSGSRDRKRGPTNLTAMTKAALLKKQVVKVAGKSVRMTRIEVVLEALLGKAMQGDLAAARELLRYTMYIDKFDKQYPEEQAERQVVVTLNLGDEETTRRIEERMIEDGVRRRLEVESGEDRGTGCG